MGDLLKSTPAQKHRVLFLDIAKPTLRRHSTYAVPTGYAVFQRQINFTLRSYGYSALFFAKYLLLLLIRKINILHLHSASYTSFWEKCAYIFAGKLSGKKIVLHIHGALFKEFYRTGSRTAQNLIKRFMRQCDAIIVLSDSWKTFFSDIVGSEKLYTVENGIDLAPFKIIEEKSGLFSILHMGEVSARKGIYDLLKVIEIFVLEKQSFHFDIVGPGELDKVASLIQQKKLEDYITLHGPQQGEKRYTFYQKAHCFILASYGEGFPIALIEAMAAGLPIVATTVGGIPDLLQNGEYGFLCEPGDVNGIAAKIRCYIENDAMRRQIGPKNRAYADAHFNIESCANKINSIYRAVLRQDNSIVLL